MANPPLVDAQGTSEAEWHLFVGKSTKIHGEHHFMLVSNTMEIWLLSQLPFLVGVQCMVASLT